MAVGLPGSAPASTVDEALSPALAGAEDEILTINGLSWSQYVAINDALGDHALVRVLYFEGRLTFVSPTYGHERPANSLDMIVKAIALGCDIELRPIASTTLRREVGKAGAEGDKVYSLHENALRIGRSGSVDLTTDPAPDLAIKVENTHKATDAPAIYARLGVPEVWRYDARRRRLTFWALRPNGTDEEVPQSLGIPILLPADVLGRLQQGEAIPPFNRWFVQLTEWVRDVIRPRLDHGPA